MVDNGIRRSIILGKISENWNKAAKENPSIDWGKTSPQIEMAERQLENAIHEYIHNPELEPKHVARPFKNWRESFLRS